jgi:hypothetical protein
MALISLPMGLDQQEGFGTVPMQSSISKFFHGSLSLIPAYREACSKQERSLAKQREDDED